MKKYLFLAVFALVTAGLFSLALSSSAKAQTYYNGSDYYTGTNGAYTTGVGAYASSSYCPTGYTCTPVQTQATSCPIGFTCTPINSYQSNQLYPNQSSYYTTPSTYYSGTGYGYTTPTYTSNNPSVCFTFTRDIRIGTVMTSAEASALMRDLVSEGLWTLNTSVAPMTYDYTLSAMVTRFQGKYGIFTTGFFGPLTRAKINALYPCNTYPYNPPYNNTAPVINSVSGPTSLSVGQTGTWAVNAYSPNNNSYLTYSVVWGDEIMYTYPAYNSASSAQFTQYATFTHTYNQAGTYTATFTVRDVSGLSSTKAVSVVVGGNSYSSLIVTSPNGGESWQRGTTHSISWTSYFPGGLVAAYLDIKLVPYYQPCTGVICPMTAQDYSGTQSIAYPYRAPYTIATNVSVNQNSYSWYVGDVLSGTAADGQYTIQVCVTGTSNCDSSDSSFLIYSYGTNTGKAPIISGIDAPTVLSVGQTGTWTVRAYDPSYSNLSYSVTWGDEGIIIPNYYGSSASSPITQNATFTHIYNQAGTYTATFTVRNYSGVSAQSSVTVQVGGSSSSAGPLRVTSPNGGEVWTLGSLQTIRWTSPYYLVATYADLKLVPRNTCSGTYCTMIYQPPYVIASGISINQNAYNWMVGRVNSPYGIYSTNGYTAPAGDYTIQLCNTGTSVCDSSDMPFTIR